MSSKVLTNHKGDEISRRGLCHCLDVFILSPIYSTILGLFRLSWVSFLQLVPYHVSLHRSFPTFQVPCGMFNIIRCSINTRKIPELCSKLPESLRHPGL